jgi:hypothetical protein
VVKYLVSKGESIYARQMGGYCALTRLIDAGGAAFTFALNSGFSFDSADTLWPLLSKVNLAFKNPFGKILIHYDRRKVAVDINTRHNPKALSNPTTPLVYASARGDEHALDRFIAHGALINREGTREGTPLMVACTYGRLPIVKTLVRLGAIFAYSKNGIIFSAVHAAQHFPRMCIGSSLIGSTSKCYYRLAPYMLCAKLVPALKCGS